MSTWMNWWGKGGSAPVPEEGPKQPNDGWRETLDTVVFVIVLVLILKTFVAECFVIPTGSMAETLYGYQKNVVCPECSHPFVVNASDEVENGNRDRNFCTCPNCLRDIEVVRQSLRESIKEIYKKQKNPTSVKNVRSQDSISE